MKKYNVRFATTRRRERCLKPLSGTGTGPGIDFASSADFYLLNLRSGWQRHIKNQSMFLIPGILIRNLSLSRITSVILYSFFDRDGRFLDYAGGYGIFTRLMRDIGFDFYWYDPYSQNLTANGFEITDGMSGFNLLTCFEAFEHFADPLKEVEKMSRLSDSILFTTALLPAHIPGANDWFYYGLHHGQHISFYSFETIRFIAKKFGYNLCSDRRNIHLFTKRAVNPLRFKFFLKLSRYSFFCYVRSRMNSKTDSDSRLIISRNKSVSGDNSL